MNYSYFNKQNRKNKWNYWKLLWEYIENRMQSNRISENLSELKECCNCYAHVECNLSVRKQTIRILLRKFYRTSLLLVIIHHMKRFHLIKCIFFTTLHEIKPEILTNASTWNYNSSFHWRMKQLYVFNYSGKAWKGIYGYLMLYDTYMLIYY